MAAVTSIQSNPCITADEAKASLSGALTDMGRTQKTRVIGTDIREVDGLYIAITHIEMDDDPEMAAQDDTEGRGDTGSGGSRQVGAAYSDMPYIILYGGTFGDSDSPFNDGDMPDPVEERFSAPNLSIQDEIYTVGMLFTDIHGRPIDPHGEPLVGVPEPQKARAPDGDAGGAPSEGPSLRP